MKKTWKGKEIQVEDGDQGLSTNYYANTRAIPVVLERDDPLRSIIEAEEDLYSIADVKAR